MSKHLLDLLQPFGASAFKFIVDSNDSVSSELYCRKAIILYSVLKPSFEEFSVTGYYLNPLKEIKENLDTLLYYSRNNFVITIGRWKGTTKDFRNSELTYQDIVEAIKNNQFEITVISS